MPRKFWVGDEVTVMPPYDDLPIILSMQRHVRVAASEITGDRGTFVQVRLDSAGQDNTFQMVPVDQVLPGWKDRDGRWL